MAIQLGNTTKLTAEVEKLFVAVGGGDPSKTYSREQLREANTLKALPEGSPILEKLHRQTLKSGNLLDIKKQRAD